MILYNGSKYVKGNVFLDTKGNKLTFDKNTKKGKIFITEKGVRIGLTENQVKKLKFSSDYNFYNVEDIPKITGVSIKYDALDKAMVDHDYTDFIKLIVEEENKILDQYLDIVGN